MGALATLPLADAVSAVQRFIEVFVLVYGLLILAHIILSLIRVGYSSPLQKVQRFLYDVCDPYLRLFRRFIPPIGPLDLSPLVGLVVLSLGGQLLSRAIGAAF
ncbi:MAG: YggT family protein [Gaiella sp.]